MCVFIGKGCNFLGLDEILKMRGLLRSDLE